MAAQPPSGTVTFLLTDLEGSTRMWEQDPDAMKAAMVRHDELLENAIEASRGFVFSRMERERELRDQGAAMSMDEAVSYALASVEPKLLAGPLF